MFSMKKDNLLFKQMSKWIKEGDNDKVKFIMEHTSPADLADENDTSLLHFSALHGNLHMTEYLMNTGFEVDIKDKSDTTPLMYAMAHERWSVAIFLLKHNADILAKNYMNDTPLSNLMKSDKLNIEVLQLSIDRVKSKGPDKREFVEILRRADCKLDKIVELHNAELTKLFLCVQVHFSREEEFSSIDIAMRSMDEDNMKVLLHHGEFQGRREDFVICLRDVLHECCRDKSLVDTLRVAIEQLVNWKLINNMILHFIESIIYESPEESLRRMLTDSLVSYIQSDFGYDIRTLMFGNRNKCVFKMVQNGEADMNALSRKGRTALHIATKCAAIDMMRYLLDNGINPNIRDKNGKTPIFKVFSHADCLKLLLLYGADLQACDNLGGTYIDFFTSPYSHFNLLIVAHLAILEVSGVPLKESFRNHVFGLEELRKHYLLCSQQLEKMKKIKVHNSLTFFETLAVSLKNLTRRVRTFDNDTIENFFNSSTIQEYDSHYVITSRERLEKAVTINALRGKAAIVICESIEVLKPYSLVIDKICGFLSYYDLRVFE